MSDAADERVVVTPKRVIYADTDAMGIVYYGNYMRFLEVGRVEFLRACGKAYKEIEAMGFQIPVAEVNLRYLSPARYDDVVDVATRLAELGGASIRFGYRLTRQSDGALLAKGFTRHAVWDMERQRAVRVPEEIARVLRGEA
jgi:acyl-CoA thioester hydrolase